MNYIILFLRKCTFIQICHYFSYLQIQISSLVCLNSSSFVKFQTRLHQQLLSNFQNPLFLYSNISIIIFCSKFLFRKLLLNIIFQKMLRRCMTPNPHSKAKYLSQLVEGSALNKKQILKINYDSFIYVDRLTNNKIVIGQAKNMYTQKQKHSTFAQSHAGSQSQIKHGKKGSHNSTARQKQYSHTKQMEQINDCFTLMKSTKLFQMENLKNKIFNKAEETQNKQNHQIDCMIKKKKKIRQFIQQHLNSLCLNQFRKYMEPTMDKNKIKLVNPNILNIHKSMPNKITRQTIQKIIDQFLQSESNNQQKRPPINISIDDIDFPHQERLKQLLMHRMCIKNKDFQHLVTPSHSKQIYSQIHSNVHQKNRPHSTNKYQQNLDQYQFCQFTEGDIPKMQRIKGKKWQTTSKKIDLKRKQLLLAIQTGSIYDFLFLIIRWPSLLQYRDHLGNNLLHIAAKHDQSQIYSLLIKKVGSQALQQTNNGGKTPIQIAKLFGSFQVQKRNQQYENSF